MIRKTLPLFIFLLLYQFSLISSLHAEGEETPPESFLCQSMAVVESHCHGLLPEVERSCRDRLSGSTELYENWERYARQCSGVSPCDCITIYAPLRTSSECQRLLPQCFLSAEPPRTPPARGTSLPIFISLERRERDRGPTPPWTFSANPSDCTAPQGGSCVYSMSVEGVPANEVAFSVEGSPAGAFTEFISPATGSTGPSLLTVRIPADTPATPYLLPLTIHGTRGGITVDKTVSLAITANAGGLRGAEEGPRERRDISDVGTDPHTPPAIIPPVVTDGRPDDQGNIDGSVTSSSTTLCQPWQKCPSASGCSMSGGTVQHPSAAFIFGMVFPLLALRVKSKIKIRKS